MTPQSCSLTTDLLFCLFLSFHFSFFYSCCVFAPDIGCFLRTSIARVTLAVPGFNERSSMIAPVKARFFSGRFFSVARATFSLLA
jgi:hypothetical protein